MAVSANRLELLQIADAVAREKAIDRGIVITAMEDAIAKAARSRYGAETDVHAEIEPKTGDLRLTRHMLVVEAVENSSNQITLEEARKRHPAAQVGDTIAVRAANGGELWRFRDGAYNPVISDGKRIYLTGYKHIYGMKQVPPGGGGSKEKKSKK